MDSLEEKKSKIISWFGKDPSLEDTYNHIIALGQKMRNHSFSYKEDQYLVPGCQSLLYLYSEEKDGKLYFQTYSDALISMGLAQLLVWYYNGETPETILKSPASFLEELKIAQSLSPSRANGLFNIHLKMKQLALAALLPNPKP